MGQKLLHYDVIERLGEGARSVIYAVSDPVTKQRYDIKPNNILRRDTGKVKIIDFGQSCKIGTIKERIQGTPDYIAPEQVKRKPVSHKTDIFDLGATMYWALTGKNIPTLYTVNQGDNSFLVDDRIDTVQDLNSSVPPALSNLVMECIASRPEKRPAGMDHVINRLELSRHILTKPQTASSPIPPP